MAFVNIPGFQYLDPVDWHPDPVQVVHGGDPSGGTYWHPSDGPLVSAEGSGLLVNTSHNRAAYTYNRVIAGPYPSDDPECGFFQGAANGLSGSDDWGGFCPTFPVGTFINSSAGGNDDGSFWSIANSARIGAAGGNQSATGLADITGWQLKPWMLYSLYDQWMNDTGREDEWSAAVEATRPPGDGWFVDNEAARPFFMGMEYAPDEPGDTAVSAGYDGAVYWIDDPTAEVPDGGTRWAYYAQSGAEPVWNAVNLPPGGHSVAVYDGGEIDWQTVPDEWLPVQDTSVFFSVEFVAPADEAAEWDATTVFTLAHSGIVNGEVTAGGEGTTTTAGRFNQTLAFRASWRLPQFRWARERTTVVRQYPRDDSLGLGSATRLYPPPKRHRLAGGYQ